MIDVQKKYLKGMKFIDLFAGLGGFRLALESLGAECVYSNEWDEHAKKVYADNFGDMPEGGTSPRWMKRISQRMTSFVQASHVRHFP